MSLVYERILRSSSEELADDQRRLRLGDLDLDLPLNSGGNLTGDDARLEVDAMGRCCAAGTCPASFSTLVIALSISDEFIRFARPAHDFGSTLRFFPWRLCGVCC